jgi:hypothetical protein
MTNTWTPFISKLPSAMLHTPIPMDNFLTSAHLGTFLGNVSVRSITIPILHVLFGFYISVSVVATILDRHILSFVHLDYLISRRHGGSEDTQAGITTRGGRIGGWGGLLGCYLWVASFFCLQGWVLGR